MCGAAGPFDPRGAAMTARGVSPEMASKHQRFRRIRIAASRCWHIRCPYEGRHRDHRDSRDRPRSQRLIARHQTARGRNVMKLYTYLRALVRKEEGQDMIEYALLAALIAIVAVVSIRAAGVSVDQIWDGVASQLSTSAASVPGGGGGGQ
jgi:pilus assembly protein Flp/PilA